MDSSRSFASLASHVRFDDLLRFREPGKLFGSGCLAGVLLFLVWLALLPSTEPAVRVEQPVPSVGPSSQPSLAGDGVLGSITGGPEASARVAAVAPAADPQADREPDSGLAEFDGQGGAAGEQALVYEGSPQIVMDGAEIAPQLVQMAPLGLQTFQVEIEIEPDVYEILEVSAESVEQARSIVRDFRGNPRITRGPTLQPLD